MSTNPAISHDLLRRLHERAERKDCSADELLAHLLDESVSDQPDLRAVLNGAADAVIAADTAQLITQWNPAAEAIYGWTAAEAIGQNAETLLKTAWVYESRTAALEILRQTGRWDGEIQQTTRRGQKRTIWASISYVRDETGKISGGVTINRDVTQIKRQELLQDRLEQVLEAVASDRDLPDILNRLVQGLETYQPDTKGSILLLDAATRQLRHVSAPSLPPAYCAAIDGIQIGPAVGSCGTAAHTKKLVIVEDIQTDPRWQDYRDLAAEYNLRACWSHPIIAKTGVVLGTFALYYHEPRRPTQNELELLQVAVHIAGITIQRKQAESAYRTLVENSLQGLLIFRRGRRALFVNTRLCQIMGYTAEEILAHENLVDGFVHPDDQAFVLQEALRILDTRETAEFEARAIHKQGHVIHLRIFFSRIEYQGTPAVQAALFDITEQSRAAARLRQLSQAVEQSPTSIVITNRDGTIEYVNPKFTEVTGYTLAEVLNQNPRFLKTNYTSEEGYQQLWQTITTGGVWRGEFLNRKKDGTTYWEAAAIVGVKTEQGDITHYVAVKEDITERKAAEREIRQLSERFSRIFQSSPAVIALTNLEDGRFIEVNDTFTEVLGFSRAETIGRTSLELNLWRLAADRAARMTELAQYQRIRNIEISFRDKSGVLHDMFGSFELLQLGANATVLAAFMDITEHKRSERLLFDYERLKASFQKEYERNALIQRVISSLSHDLKTPFSVISNAKHILANYYDQLTREKRQEKLDTIERQLQYALELLNDTVALVRGNLNDSGFHPAAVNIETLCRVSVTEVGEAHHVSERMRFVNSGDVRIVTVDETLVSRILSNLLTNAVKYSPEGGEILLELNQQDKQVVLRVRDHGIGIHADDLPHIFDPFYRAKGVHLISGSGLGLSIVKDCVERHQGGIHVESVLGQGSIFTVELPLAITMTTA